MDIWKFGACVAGYALASHPELAPAVSRCCPVLPMLLDARTAASLVWLLTGTYLRFAIRSLWESDSCIRRIVAVAQPRPCWLGRSVVVVVVVVVDGRLRATYKAARPPPQGFKRLHDLLMLPNCCCKIPVPIAACFTWFKVKKLTINLSTRPDSGLAKKQYPPLPATRCPHAACACLSWKSQLESS